MQPSGAECAFHPIYDARALAQQVFPLAVGAPRVLLGWGFRAQETHEPMKDKAAHACHALRRARVADELQRAGERTAEST
jgi:hypothetical protein